MARRPVVSARVGPVVPVRQPVPVLRAVRGAGLAVCAVVLGIAVLVVLRGADPAGPLPLDPLAGRFDSVPPVSAPPTSAPPATAPPATAAPAAMPPALPPPVRLPLTVLNNSRIPDLAATAAARYRAAGWPVLSVGSFRGRIVRSTVYYAAGERDQARAVAAAFGLPRVLPRFAGLPGQGLTVVVTRDLA